MNIVAVISHVPNPRANRRMEQFSKIGNTTLIYWDKGGESCPIQELEGVVQKGYFLKASRTNTLKRMLPMLSYKKQVIGWLNEIMPEVIYAERFDMLYIIWSYWRRCRRKPKLFFEVPDLPHMMVDKDISLKERVVSKAVRFLENKIYKNISGLIVTSEKFYDDYYSKWINKEKVVYIPNSPNLEPFKNYKHKRDGIFTVGFIGVVRYPEQLKMLIEAADELNIKVLFAGFTEGCPEIQAMAETRDNVVYYGRYDYDKDIAKLYGMCDAIYSVYDSKMKNVNIALPNKLYEAVYCELPIIVSKGTYLSEIVGKYNVGISVTSNEKESLISALKRLSTDAEYYQSFVNSCKQSNKELCNTDYGVSKLYGLLQEKRG